jgi:phage shock protein A
MLVTAWARDITLRQETTETQLAVMSQHYASIEEDLQFLREQLHDLRQEIKDNEQYGKIH